MEVINGQLRAGTGMNMRIKHNSNLKIMVMMKDEVDTEEDEAVAEDLEEGSVVEEEAAVTRMGIVVDMVATMVVATEEAVAATMTVVVVKDTEAREVVVVASEVKTNPVVEVASEADVVVKEVTVVMVDITEGSEAANNSIKNKHNF